MIRDAPRIIQALEDIPGIERVTRGWPKENERLPCLAVSEASNRHALFYGDKPYADEVTMDVRIFAVSASDVDELAPEVEAVMVGLGYARILSYDDDSSSVRMLVMRYQRLFG